VNITMRWVACARATSASEKQTPSIAERMVGKATASPGTLRTAKPWPPAISRHQAGLAANAFTAGGRPMNLDALQRHQHDPTATVGSGAANGFYDRCRPRVRRR
jgi:hypothetical protein